MGTKSTMSLETSIDDLYEQFMAAQDRIKIGIILESDEELSRGLKEALRSTEAISRKPRLVRENWFTRESNMFCCAIDEENYEFAAKLLVALKYFRHSFLQDSDIANDLSNDTLSLLSMYK